MITFETDEKHYKDALEGFGWTLPSAMNPEPERIVEPLQTGLLPPWSGWPIWQSHSGGHQARTCARET